MKKSLQTEIIRCFKNKIICQDQAIKELTRRGVSKKDALNLLCIEGEK